MKVSNSPSLSQPETVIATLRRWLPALLLVLLFGQWSTLASARSIDELRIEQQQALKQLENSYHEKVRSNPDLIKPDGTVDTDHPEYRQIIKEYSQEKANIQGGFNEQDGRGGDLEQLKKRFGTSLNTTGSSPKDVRADVDITANDPRVAAKIAAEWEANEDVVRYDQKLGIYINETQDITLWQPPSEEQLAERQKYHDAFSTPGGKQATNVKGNESVRDPEGFVLDNEKKFIHGAEDLGNSDINSDDAAEQLKRDMALKTMGKSVSKAADAVEHESEVIKQAQGLRNYGDKFETGITPLGATPEQQQTDERRWIQQADQEVQNTKPAAAEKSQKIRETREQLAKTVEQSNKGGANGAATESANNIRNRNQILGGANEQARTANATARKQAGLRPAPKPDAQAIADQTAKKAARTAQKPTPAEHTTKREGSSQNSNWQTTETRRGGEQRKMQRSTTVNQDGSITQRETRTDSKRTAGGGKLSEQKSRTTTTAADGSGSDKRQQSNRYDGKKASSATTRTTETERNAKGQVTRQSDTTESRTTRAGKHGTESRTHETRTTREQRNGWLPGSQRTTTTESSKITHSQEQGGVKRTTESETTTTSDDRSGRQTTTRRDSSTTGTRDAEGRETTRRVTTTTTEGPWSKSRETTGSYARNLKPGGDPNEPNEGERIGDPTKFNVKIAGGKLFEPVDVADKTAATSGAGQTDSGGDYGYDAQVQTGQYGATGTWEVTANQRGAHVKIDTSAEVNAVKLTATGSAEQKLGDATVGAKVTATAKVGAEGKVTTEGHLGADRVATSLEAKVFIGGKAETAAEASLSLWGLKLTGKAQGEVSAGAGAEAKVDMELSWTKIRLGGKVAATLGLGAGGGTSVELDASVAITGYDLNALEQQIKAGEAIAHIARAIRTGRLVLPKDLDRAQLRELLQQRAELYAKYPQKRRDGTPISLIDSLINELKLQKGKNNSYITAHHKQRDWYCTNRPQTQAKVVLPSIVGRAP
ncbi:MAG: hypothetical protein KDI83_19220 [Gammaproteobacteria bacterium]|nr:hypothetical protein [Gammaproteobacteria bacterium]